MRSQNITGQITVLVVALAFVVGFMVILGREKPSELPPTGDEYAKVVNQTYYNTLLDFAISAPSTDWEIIFYGQSDSLRRENVELAVFENVNPVVELRRYDRNVTVALVEVGVIDLQVPQTPRGLAERNLAEVKQMYLEQGDTVRVIKPVTATSTGSLQGAYYVIEIPNSYPLPIWVVTFVVRNQMAYTIICQVTREDYDYFRGDLAAIIQSFHFL